MTYSSGCVYEGTWSRDRPKAGRTTDCPDFEPGGKYSGEVKDGQRVGQGTFLVPTSIPKPYRP